MTENSNGKAVLVVDDDPDFRALVVAIGEFCKVPIFQACDCNQALDVLEQNGDSIKMILLDYFMPGMEPSQCAAAVIAKAAPPIQVVLVTAAADPSARAAELKIRRWLSKPFEASTLTKLIA